VGRRRRDLHRLNDARAHSLLLEQNEFVRT